MLVLHNFIVGLLEMFIKISYQIEYSTRIILKQIMMLKFDKLLLNLLYCIYILCYFRHSY